MKHTDYCQTRRLPNIPMLKHSKEFFMLTFTLWFMSENNVKSRQTELAEDPPHKPRSTLGWQCHGWPCSGRVPSRVWGRRTGLTCLWSIPRGTCLYPPGRGLLQSGPSGCSEQQRSYNITKSETNIWHSRLRHVQVNRQGVQRYLGNGEAELGQLGLSHQRDGDAVGQNQVGADDVLNDAVTQTTAGEEQGKDWMGWT